MELLSPIYCQHQSLYAAYIQFVPLQKKDKQLNRSAIMGLVINNLLLFIAGLPIGVLIVFLT